MTWKKFKAAMPTCNFAWYVAWFISLWLGRQFTPCMMCNKTEVYSQSMFDITTRSDSDKYALSIPYFAWQSCNWIMLYMLYKVFVSFFFQFEAGNMKNLVLKIIRSVIQIYWLWCYGHYYFSCFLQYIFFFLQFTNHHTSTCMAVVKMAFSFSNSVLNP